MTASRMSISGGTEQRGAVLVVVALLLLVLLGFAALAVDIGHLAVVKNELQNAADAGALAGASQLYYRQAPDNPSPEDPNNVGRINPGANAAAEAAAEKNSSVNVAVEVTLDGDNGGDVQRGHWSFWERKFYPLDTLDPIAVGNYTDDQLDHMDGQGGNPAFVNAVRVTTHRKDTLAPAFFSKIFDYTGFEMEAEAIAYLGYGGTFEPGDFDWPIAICEESILDPDGNYQCGQVRLINSSAKSTSNTGGWTNYSADCVDNVSASNIRDIFSYQNATNNDCDGSNNNFIDGTISVGGGEIDVSFTDMMQCGDFDSNGSIRDQPWKLTMPVVDCDGTSGSGTMTGGQIGGCYQVTGAVTIDVVLITRVFSNNIENRYDDLPSKMGDWTKDTSLSGEQNWRNFVDAFDLHVNGVPATEAPDLGYYQQTIYARPSCERTTPSGRTGGINTGVMAEDPVLVKGSINY